MRKGQPWRTTYRGWRITHDPLGHLACYRLGQEPIRWCYFGNCMFLIKLNIDQREDYLESVRQHDA